MTVYCCKEDEGESLAGLGLLGDCCADEFRESEEKWMAGAVRGMFPHETGRPG